MLSEPTGSCIDVSSRGVASTATPTRFVSSDAGECRDTLKRRDVLAQWWSKMPIDVFGAWFSRARRSSDVGGCSLTPLAISSARCCYGTTQQTPVAVAHAAHLRCAHDAIARYPGRPSTRGLDRLLLVWETRVAKGDEALHGVGVFGKDGGHRVDMLLQVGPGFRL